LARSGLNAKALFLILQKVGADGSFAGVKGKNSTISTTDTDSGRNETGWAVSHRNRNRHAKNDNAIIRNDCHILVHRFNNLSPMEPARSNHVEASFIQKSSWMYHVIQAKAK
jgi:hypothetical protein